MPLTIDDPKVERLARELAAATGEPEAARMEAAVRAAAERGAPLLYKGDDFARTDTRSATY